jgi:hypothetical protein
MKEFAIVAFVALLVWSIGMLTIIFILSRFIEKW